LRSRNPKTRGHRHARIAGAAAVLFLAIPAALLAQETGGAEPEPPRDFIALSAGTFVSTSDVGLSLLHIAGSFEHQVSRTVYAVGEIGVVAGENGQFFDFAPALRVNLMPDLPQTAYLRAGPAVLGTTSGALVFAHLAAGFDFARGAEGLRVEVRTYVRPEAVDFGVLEVLVGWGFGLGE
jgi:hypothetical protein